MMMSLIKMAFIAASVFSIIGCVENNGYTSDYYSSSGAQSQASDYYSDVTSGYNRDYQTNGSNHHRHSNGQREQGGSESYHSASR